MDKLRDKLKNYESITNSQVLLKELPVVARIDGRHFSSFTRGLARPFDSLFSQMMVDTTRFLAEETNAFLGYTQSDEISLYWKENEKAELYFGGKVIKIVSALAAQASVYFYRLCCERLPEYAKKFPTFDARVFNLPNENEGLDYFKWRTIDATKNSISMAARELYSDKQLFEKKSNEKQELLWQKGVNWNDYPFHFKRGTFIKKFKEKSYFTEEERDNLPMQHAGKYDPLFSFERSVWKEMDFFPLKKEEIFA